MDEERLGPIRSHLEGDEFLNREAEFSASQEPKLEAMFETLRAKLEVMPAEARTGLERLMGGVEWQAYAYIEGVINHVRANRAYAIDRENPSLRDRLESSDRRRNLAHTALIDSLNALLRKAQECDIEGAQAFAEQFSGHTDDPAHRERMTMVALGFVYRQILRTLREKEEKES